MDDTPAPEGTQDEPTTARAPDAARGRSPAWPSPPPRTIEHAVALLAATWTRERGAA